MEGIVVSDLQVADNAILLLEANKAGLHNLKKTIDCFEMVKIESLLDRSSISAISVRAEEVIKLAGIMGCK